jgi:hypothetical protein
MYFLFHGRSVPDRFKYARPPSSRILTYNLSQHKVIPPGLGGHIVQGRTVSIHCLVAAQDRDTSHG